MTGYTLYGYPESGSAAVELAMLEAGIPFALKDLNPDAGDLGSADFLAINPRGQVPALIHPDGSVITEVPAILLHLADAHPEETLAPTPGTSARAQHDRWLAFVHANCYEGALRYYYAERYTTEPAQARAVRNAARAYVIRHFNLLAQAINNGPFLFGEAPMAVDFVIWIIATWLAEDDISGLDRKITQLAQALAKRPRLVAAADRHMFS